jgi:prophage antirepressor-like protein
LSAIARRFEFDSAELRTIAVNDEPWFVAADACRILGLKNTTMALKALDDDEKGLNQIETPGGLQKMAIVSESGLYALIVRSDKENAKPFRKWVTSEVIPAIRKTGRYEIASTEAALPVIASQPELDRVAIARAQIEMLGVGVSTGLLDKLWATSKTHIIAARVLGEEPELPETVKPYYVPDFLKDMGLTSKEIKSEQSWFGKRVKAYAEDQGIEVPELRPRELPNGEIRETRAWRREHLPLFQAVWEQYYAEKYASPMFLELGAA